MGKFGQWTFPSKLGTFTLCFFLSYIVGTLNRIAVCAVTGVAQYSVLILVLDNFLRKLHIFMGKYENVHIRLKLTPVDICHISYALYTTTRY